MRIHAYLAAFLALSISPMANAAPIKPGKTTWISHPAHHTILLPVLVALTCWIAAWLLSLQRRMDQQRPTSVPRPNASPWLRLAGFVAAMSTALWLPDGPVRWTTAALFGAVALAATANTWRDLGASVVLWLEDTAPPGTHVQTAQWQGVLRSRGWRQSAIELDDGNTRSVPNRLLIADTTSLSRPGPWQVVLSVRAPDDVPAEHIKEQLVHATAVSPWRALDVVPEVTQDPSEPTIWTVRLALLDRSYENKLREQLARAVRADGSVGG